jgi:predicted kinase
MAKLIPTKPLLILLYGFPGSGKTHFARQLSETINAAHIHGDRIRNELFDEPRYDKQENDVVDHLMQYMSEEFLKSGMSVIYDANTMRLSERRKLRDMARKVKAQPVLIWLQIDTDSALARLGQRDRRKVDDKYAASYNKASFNALIGNMQNPHTTEDYIVISGKHTFNTQRSAVVKKMYEMGLIATDQLTSSVVKPGLVNLVPNPTAGRVDMSRRNIVIR